MEEDIITIHLGKVVSDNLYQEITQYLIDKLNEKYSWLIKNPKSLS